VRGLLRQAAAAAGFDDVAADVLDARKLRIIAESVAQCDALDARVLNQLSRANLKLPTCYLPDDEEFALREHLRARSDLVRMRGKWGQSPISWQSKHDGDYSDETRQLTTTTVDDTWPLTQWAPPRGTRRAAAASRSCPTHSPSPAADTPRVCPF
jgi:hypothetical protein